VYAAMSGLQFIGSAAGGWGAVENIGREYLPRIWAVIQMIWIYEESVRNINIFLSRKYMKRITGIFEFEVIFRCL